MKISRRNSRGITLVELLLSLAVMGILAGVNAQVLAASLDAWNHSQSRLDLQQVSNDMMGFILDGGFEESGLRDAVELTEVSLSSVAFVPLWIDRSHVPAPLRNKAQKFVLEKKFKAGAIVPIGQIRLSDREDWVSVPVSFDSGTDTVIFTKPIPAGNSIRILYTPDPEAQPETVMRFWLDPVQKNLLRSYAGTTRPVSRRMRGVRVEKLAFLYYDNFNQLFPLDKVISAPERRRITGAKIYLSLKKGKEWKELTSFTNIRNVQTVGVTVSKGVRLPLPDPRLIKAMSIGDFSGLKGAGIVDLEVQSKGRARWKIRLEFKPGASESEMILRRFEIQAPKGSQRTSSIMDQSMARIEFVNLLAIDRTGLFDYDDDPDIRDAVLLTGTDNVLVVTRCDFDLASMFIRP
ncbi:MAG: prepilin-type N-terminal cleavage/methylation domain-containing protein [Candidatus Omnitrophota bacterium]|nr:prepilin-type N-terminal cleavage/methylation domain-containing protein [Candidatus Omnitrophota bacterium]